MIFVVVSSASGQPFGRVNKAARPRGTHMSDTHDVLVTISTAIYTMTPLFGCFLLQDYPRGIQTQFW